MIKIQSYITKDKAIEYIRKFHNDIHCKDCNADKYCESLRKRGYESFEDLEEYQIQAIINRIDGIITGDYNDEL